MGVMRMGRTAFTLVAVVIVLVGAAQLLDKLLGTTASQSTESEALTALLFAAVGFFTLFWVARSNA